MKLLIRTTRNEWQVTFAGASWEEAASSPSSTKAHRSCFESQACPSAMDPVVHSMKTVFLINETVQDIINALNNDHKGIKVNEPRHLFIAIRVIEPLRYAALSSSLEFVGITSD